MVKIAGSKKLKRQMAPLFWGIRRKEKRFVVTVKPGPHKKNYSIPTAVLLRDKMKIVSTLREAKSVIYAGKITIDGVKREKTKGEKVDVPIHATNVIITGLNDDDKWRMNKLQGNSKDSLKKIKQKEAEEREINEKTKESKTKSLSKTKKEKDVKK